MERPTRHPFYWLLAAFVVGSVTSVLYHFRSRTDDPVLPPEFLKALEANFPERPRRTLPAARAPESAEEPTPPAAPVGEGAEVLPDVSRRPVLAPPKQEPPAAPGSAQERHAEPVDTGMLGSAKRAFGDLLQAPLEFLKESTYLGSPEETRSYLRDPQVAKRYMENPLVKATLNSPNLLTYVVSSPVLVNAFLETPAMKDAETVQALAGSSLFKEVLASPAVAYYMSSEENIAHLLSNPPAQEWLQKNPQVMQVLWNTTPAVRKAIEALPKPKEKP